MEILKLLQKLRVGLRDGRDKRNWCYQNREEVDRDIIEK